MTIERLISEGFDEAIAKQMVAQCLAVELYNVINDGKPYNNERYVKSLIRLPKEPF